MHIYGKDFPDYPVIILKTGEQVKTLESVEFIIEEMLKPGADRHTFIVGIGSGIVCGMTGFVASIYMQGLRFGCVSTTLPTQVDASVGGKPE